MSKGYPNLGELQKWLLRQLNHRNESAREASLGAKLNHGAISHYLGGNRPSPMSCRKLARYFEVPAEMLLYLAGYISAPRDHDAFVKQMSEISEEWTEDERQEVLDMVLALCRVRGGRKESA